MSDFVRPVCLPPRRAEVTEGAVCSVIGWGQLFESGRIFRESPTLQLLQLADSIYADLMGMNFAAPTTCCEWLVRFVTAVCRSGSGHATGGGATAHHLAAVQEAHLPAAAVQNH